MKKVGKGILSYWGTAVIIIGIILWYDWASATADDAFKIICPRVSVLAAGVQEAMPKLLEGLLSSCKLLLPGYFGSAFIGIVAGCIISYIPWLHHTLRPIIYALSSIPATVYVPYAVLLSATFYQASLFLMFIGTVWRFLNGTIEGIAVVDQRYLDSAATLDLKGAKLLFHVILPGASPTILSAATNALNGSFTLLTVAEMFACRSGLGYFIQFSKDMANYGDIIIGMIFLASMIVICKLIFDKVKRRMLFWTMNKIGG